MRAHAGGLEFDSDAALALDVHIVQELRLQVPVRHRLRHLLEGKRRVSFVGRKRPGFVWTPAVLKEAVVGVNPPSRPTAAVVRFYPTRRPTAQERGRSTPGGGCGGVREHVT